MVYPRVWEDWDGATNNDKIRGPSADMPKGWGHQLPVTHIDIKIPSEHTMEGRQYAAEYQIHLIQNRPSQRGAPVVSVLFDLHPDNKPNKKLQELLDEFQAVWDWDMGLCRGQRRRNRRLNAVARQTLSQVKRMATSSTWLDEPEEEETRYQYNMRTLQVEAKKSVSWNCWHKDIIKSIWFFGYEGSLTEPPCTEFVEWRIIDTPAFISKEQLSQMKWLLFGHVDKKCRKTSVHWEHSVARPTQPLRGRNVHRCMCRDYIADADRDAYGLERCRWQDRDEFGFPKEQYTMEWYDTTHSY